MYKIKIKKLKENAYNDETSKKTHTHEQINTNKQEKRLSEKNFNQYEY
jgi:hypothetical protein